MTISTSLSDEVRRFLGVHWDPTLPPEEAGEGWGTGGMDEHCDDADHPEQVLENPRPGETREAADYPHSDRFLLRGRRK